MVQLLHSLPSNNGKYNYFHTVDLIGTVHDISAEIVHLFNCGEVITKAAALRGSLIINSDKVCCGAPPELSGYGRNVFVLFYIYISTASL